MQNINNYLRNDHYRHQTSNLHHQPKKYCQGDTYFQPRQPNNSYTYQNGDANINANRGNGNNIQKSAATKSNLYKLIDDAEKAEIVRVTSSDSCDVKLYIIPSKREKCVSDETIKTDNFCSKGDIYLKPKLINLDWNSLKLELY